MSFGFYSAGSHTLGKLRSNETGFSGDYTSQMDVLSNEFFTMMASGTSWKQHKKNVVIDEFPQTRFGNYNCCYINI